MTSHHGMIMAPPGSGGGGDGDGPKKPKQPTRESRTPSGMAHPAVRPDESVPKVAYEPPADAMPMPVVLAKGTFLKFAFMLLGSLLVSISAILAFYWKHHYAIDSHMSDKTIHLNSGERARLETKSEAQASRKDVVQKVKQEIDLKHREVVVKQKEEIQRIGEELKTAQRQQLRQLLLEVRQTRRAVGRSPAANSHP